MDSGQLRILYWNPGGVRGKASALCTLARSQDIHIILLGETKLQQNVKFSVPNYFIYRRDEVSPQGVPYRGTAVLVRRDIIHEELEDLDFTQTRTKGVRLTVAGRETRLLAGYRPPSHTLDTGDFSRIFDGRTPTLMAADLNAKHHSWGSRVISNTGRRLMAVAEHQGFEVIGPDTPTNIPTNPRHRADVLDIVLHQRMQVPVSLEVLYDLDEQHLPLLITMGGTMSHQLPRPQRVRVDWEAFRRDVQSMSVSQLSTATEVESCATALTDHIRAAKEAATTILPKTAWREELPPRLQELRRKKRRMHELWAHSRCPAVKRELNAMQARVSREVQEWRGTAWDNRIDQAGERSSDLHSLNRQLTRAKQPICPLLDSTGTRKYLAQDRAEILADHLQEQFQPHPVPPEASPAVRRHHEEVLEQVAEILRTPAPPLGGDDFISPAEVARAVRGLQLKKAPGDDGITNAALRRMPTRGLTCLARLFNGILRTGHFPTAWKLGKVIVLPKPNKDRRQASSYRPITLLSHVAKLFERLLLRRLTPHLKPREEQFGFRTHHSTTLQLTRVLHHLTEESNARRKTVAVFLDVEKAFDRVWHEGLIFKLAQTTLPRALLAIVASFLAERTFYVAVENTNSGQRTIAAGVPQGSCLSPALYAVYTDDIPTLEEDQRLPGERGVTLALFADDSAFIASSRRATIAAGRMQRLLNALPDWLDKWRMAVNVGKTAALLTGVQRRNLPPKLKLRGEDIEWETTVKYLGVYIDRLLSMRPQVDHATRTAKAARAMLRPVLTSKLPLKTKVGVFKTYIRTRLTYAAPAWYALCSNTQRKRLQVVQNVTLRQCTGAGRYVRNDVIARDVKIETVGEFVVRMARGMYDRADNGPHPHLRNIAPHHARPPDVTAWRALPRDIVPKGDEESEGARHGNRATLPD